MNSFKHLVVFFICLLSFVFSGFTSAVAEKDQASKIDPSEDEYQRLMMVVNNVKKHYIKPISDKEIFDHAIQGMLSTLDPHSAYLQGAELKDLELLMDQGKFYGIGINLEPYQGSLKVISSIDGTPADKAGIKAGDVIIQIDGKQVKDMDLSKAAKLLNGEKGSKIALTILHKNQDKPQTLVLIRDTIKIQSVKWRLLAPNYGYLRIALFQKHAGDEVEKAIDDLKKAAKGKLQGLVLDLRNNPGGLIEEAIQVSNYFLDADKLKDNKTIVYTKGRGGEAQLTAKALYGSFLPNVSVVVLINEGTASAAEVVAGALQDQKRAVIAGEKSFGKGSVQTRFPIDKGSEIKITTSLYYTPLGHSIQAKGIVPDVIIGNTKISKNSQTPDIIDAEKNLDGHIPNGNGDSNETIQQIHAALQTRENDELALAHEDYQLYEALHLLQGVNAINQATFTQQ